MFKLKSHIPFVNYFKIFNLISLILILISVGSILYKGLNFGVDFKGGTLIELRVDNEEITISDVRDSFLKIPLDDVNVKKFGKKNDYFIKFKRTKNNEENFIEDIKTKLTKNMGSNFTIRRVENVGPKVSKELLKAGLIAIVLSLSAMLIYIWIRFEWQFSLGAIIALVHDLIITTGFFSIFELVFYCPSIFQNPHTNFSFYFLLII